MNDHTTIPLKQGGGVYGPSSTAVDSNSSLRGGKPVDRPQTFDIIGTSTNVGGGLRGSHDNCSTDSMTETTQYRPDVDVGLDQYSNTGYGKITSKQYPWSGFAMPSNFPKFGRKRKKKNRTYCM